MDQRNQAWMGSRPSEKPCTGCLQRQFHDSCERLSEAFGLDLVLELRPIRTSRFFGDLQVGHDIDQREVEFSLIPDSTNPGRSFVIETRWRVLRLFFTHHSSPEFSNAPNLGAFGCYGLSAASFGGCQVAHM